VTAILTGLNIRVDGVVGVMGSNGGEVILDVGLDCIILVVMLFIVTLCSFIGVVSIIRSFKILDLLVFKEDVE